MNMIPVQCLGPDNAPATTRGEWLIPGSPNASGIKTCFKKPAITTYQHSRAPASGANIRRAVSRSSDNPVREITRVAIPASVRDFQATNTKPAAENEPNVDRQTVIVAMFESGVGRSVRHCR